MLYVRRVVGKSMLPVLKPGRVVIAKKGRPERGQVVVARMAGREVIKRIQSAADTGLFLAGDNADGSTDSRSHGAVKMTDVLGVVVWPRNL